MKKCEECGGIHWRTAPCVARKETGISRAAEPAINPRKSTATKVGAVSNQHRSHGSSMVEQGGASCDGPSLLAAGSIPALPVDTNSVRVQKASTGNADGGKPLTQTRPAKFDKAAWMRERMPAYMRKYRAEVKAGMRIPKLRSDK